MQTTTVLECPCCAGPATIAIIESATAGTHLPRHEIRFHCPQRCAVDDIELLRLWVVARMRELEAWSDGWPQREVVGDAMAPTPPSAPTSISA